MFLLLSLLLPDIREADVVSLLSTVPSWRDQAAGFHTLTPAHHSHKQRNSFIRTLHLHLNLNNTELCYLMLLLLLRYLINIKNTFLALFKGLSKGNFAARKFMSALIGNGKKTQYCFLITKLRRELYICSHCAFLIYLLYCPSNNEM